ncbi:MAG TPA: helix-turn-helix transcriptional regulator [Beijerinckiaceae bacterium]|jgi:predicted XRE-type DNA-binding protein|nr:helix-turn-helix transcriptional regulator [Beijerinckiaceae bacterium]
MSDKYEAFAVERGSGNVFADLGLPDAQTLQLKARIAAEIIKVLDKRRLGLKEAAELTGVDASDFSRVRRGKLTRLSVDRLLRMAERLGRRAKISFARAA